VTARTGLAITVTDPRGAPIAQVRVTLTGPSDRSGTTDTMGQLKVTGLQMGTYRLLFAGDGVITFEREVAIRAGQTSDIDVTLTAAPAPPPPPPTAAAPAPAAPAPVGPKGQALIQSVPDVIEKNFIGNQMRRETLLSCSGNVRSTLIQLNGPLPSRVYDTADATYYVIGGEGTVTLDGKEQPMALNDAVSVPRGTLHAFTRRGRRTFIILAVLGGEACEEGK
jgi:mannose-6-phosphate isomerase-like protein (cupin superfamily)